MLREFRRSVSGGLPKCASSSLAKPELPSGRYTAIVWNGLARELAMETEQPGVACAASMDKARLAGFLNSGRETRRDVASVSIVLSAEDLALE